MRTGNRPAWRRRPQGRAARIAVPLAIPMALGLTLGAVLAFTGGPSSTTIRQSAVGATATPSASASAAPTVSAAASPTATATATAPAAAAAANVSCDIVVPANPLTAQGLATPWQLTGTGGASPAASGCTMANFANLGAFVQATILNPATGQLSVYEPLVITQGTQSAVAPVVPTLPRRCGRHDRRRVQRHQPDPGRRHRERPPAGKLRERPERLDLRAGVLLQRHPLLPGRVPGRSRGQADGPCAGHLAEERPGLPDDAIFDLVDQDPSDNVTSTYLLTGRGRTAQYNAANAAALAGARPDQQRQ